MIRKIQKDVERAALDKILAALALTPDSEPEVGEAPDFIIQLRGQSIGVEITLYSSGEIIDGTVDRRAAESGWDLLKAAAQEFWSQHDDLRAVNVGVQPGGAALKRESPQSNRNASPMSPRTTPLAVCQPWEGRTSALELAHVRHENGF